MTAILNTDDQRGHFILTGLDPHGRGKQDGEVTGVDLGTGLHLWTQGAHLSADEARLLAGALTQWANRCDARQHRDDEPDDDDQLDLFGETA